LGAGARRDPPQAGQWRGPRRCPPLLRARETELDLAQLRLGALAQGRFFWHFFAARAWRGLCLHFFFVPQEGPPAPISDSGPVAVGPREWGKLSVSELLPSCIGEKVTVNWHFAGAGTGLVAGGEGSTG